MTKEQAIKHIRSRMELYIHTTQDNFALHRALEALEQPEIIRCKDCCFYAISKEKRSWCKDMLRRIQPEDFCSHARRREE